MKASEIIKIIEKQQKILCALCEVLASYTGNMVLQGCEVMAYSVLDELGELSETLQKKVTGQTENKELIREIDPIPGNGKDSRGVQDF